MHGVMMGLKPSRTTDFLGALALCQKHGALSHNLFLGGKLHLGEMC